VASDQRSSLRRRKEDEEANRNVHARPSAPLKYHTNPTRDNKARAKPCQRKERKRTIQVYPAGHFWLNDSSIPLEVFFFSSLFALVPFDPLFSGLFFIPTLNKVW
jgi:hypothetical protein